MEIGFWGYIVREKLITIPITMWNVWISEKTTKQLILTKVLSYFFLSSFYLENIQTSNLFVWFFLFVLFSILKCHIRLVFLNYLYVFKLNMIQIDVWIFLIFFFVLRFFVSLTLISKSEISFWSATLFFRSPRFRICPAVVQNINKFFFFMQNEFQPWTWN